MSSNEYFNRDLSWLSFNRRVLEEAANEQVPLLERIKFLSIYSSNLDEFYRVRVPVLRALQKIGEKSEHIDADEHTDLLQQASAIILSQQQRFGQILTTRLIPLLTGQNIRLVYNEPLPDALSEQLSNYFLSAVLAYLQPVKLNEKTRFFPGNNRLYLVVELKNDKGEERLVLVNIPSEELPRFYTKQMNGLQYICFLDDIVRDNLHKLFKETVKGCYSFKITRDAELDLKDEYPGELSDQIEQQLNKRDLGLATRFLYQADMPLRVLENLTLLLDLQNATTVEGGRYHNLKDFSALPVKGPNYAYEQWPPAGLPGITASQPLAEYIKDHDLLVSPPYQTYDIILRFFNEAASDPDVEEINVTLYRVASDSRIVNALITAAKNGKQVRVVIELKARFDEANNLKWAKKMKNAGVQIIYSVTALKVHAKMVLVKTRKGKRMVYSGLLATGNFNEGTARFYTDHIMLTTNPHLLREAELLFIFLAKRQKPSPQNQIAFKHLLVAQFNLRDRFLALMDNEIKNAEKGLPAGITIKMNNLEERAMIDKLYAASRAGVRVSLIIRGVCCLMPGVKGMSENIVVKRIIDRYLEHGRVFVFENKGDKQVFLGSADWMNRNLHHRIEVCFPVHDEGVKQQLLAMINLQLNDNVQAVTLNKHLENIPVKTSGEPVQSQKEIYHYLSV